MKISTPLRFFTGNTNNENYSENYKDALLMARGDVICQYSAEDIPENWVDFKDITDVSIYKWIRMSFDSGTTWPLQSKLNSNVILEFSFEINDTNIINNQDDQTFIKRYRYVIDNLTQFQAIKNNPTAVYVENGNNSLSVIAPIVYRELDGNYYLDVLFTDSFVSTYTNKICVVKVLNNSAAGAFAVPVPVYSNYVNAIPQVYDDELSENVCYLDESFNTIKITNNLDNCTKLSLKTKYLSDTPGNIKIKLEFINKNNNITVLASKNIITVSTEEKWIDIEFSTPINGNLQINRLYDNNNSELISGNNITAIITNIKVESRG